MLKVRFYLAFANLSPTVILDAQVVSREEW